MSPTQEKAPQGVAAPQERHGLSQERRIGARRRSLDYEADELDGGALGQHVFQLARGQALQGDMPGRGGADDADFRRGQRADRGNIHIYVETQNYQTNLTKI